MDETTAVFKISGPNIERDTFTVGAAGLRAGRSGDNELVLASSEISRHHMRFEWIGGQIAVRDLNSSNGIWFNDERIRPDVPLVLMPGNLIRVGPFTITLERIDTPTKKRGKAQPEATLEDIPAAAPPPLPAPEPEPQPESYVPVTAAPAAEPEPQPVQAVEEVPPPPETPAPPQVEPVAEEAIKTMPPAEPPSKPKADAEKKTKEKEKEAPAKAAEPVEPPPADAQSFIFTPLSLDDSEPAPPPPAKPAAKEDKGDKEKEDGAEAKPASKKKSDAVSQFVPAAPPVEKPPADGEKEKAKFDAEDPYNKIPVIGGDGASLSPGEPLPPLPSTNGAVYPIGIPRDSSTWMKYLPSIYLDDDFVGRFLLIFEAMMSPAIWIIDNMDMYFMPEMAPLEWVRWIASWFDVLIVPELPEERQRAILSQVGWLAQRRGTKAGLERLLELYFGVRPEIIEEPAHFTVKLPLSESNVKLPTEIIDKLIMTHKPAFASYTLEIT